MKTSTAEAVHPAANADTETRASGERFDVYSIRTSQRDSRWVRLGSAFVNRDGSINVYLDALPLEGRLHLRHPSTSPKAVES